MNVLESRVAGFLILIFVAGALFPAPLYAQVMLRPYRFALPEINIPAEYSAEDLAEDPVVRSKQRVTLAGSEVASTAAGESTATLKEARDYELNGNYFTDLLADTGYILSSPLRWDAGDWFKVSLVLGGTGILFAFDDEIHDWVQGHRSDGTDTLSDIVEPFGSGLYVVPAFGLFYGWGHFLDNERARRVGLLGVESYLIANLLSLTVKSVTGRHRPGDHRGAHAWDTFKFNSNLSFPSGHTTSAFAAATVIASEYDDLFFMGPLAYGLATLVAYSRLNDDRHFASDVFFGGALGYFTAKTVMKLHDNKKRRHFTIYPRIGSSEAGLMLAYRF